MGLTQDDLSTLKAHFLPGEHEFLRGFTYITERAVTDRIETVDPSWTFELLNSHVRDNQAVVVGRMTIKGVSRDGVGMQDIKEKAGEPEKGAATDALKRCARLFGIGRYLLDLPNNVTDVASLTRFLNGSETAQNGANSSATKKNGQPQGNAPEIAEWQAVSVTIRKAKSGNPYLVYNSDQGKASGHGRDGLRGAGYECDDWTEIDQTYKLDPPANISVKRNGEYWNVDKVLGKAEAELAF